jgi:hypothetical protein
LLEQGSLSIGKFNRGRRRGAHDRFRWLKPGRSSVESSYGPEARSDSHFCRLVLAEFVGELS